MNKLPHEPIVIVGATSAIARALAHRWAAAKHDLILVGRDKAALAADANDLSVRFKIKTQVIALDVTKPAQHKRLEAQLDKIKPIRGLVVAFGILGPDQNEEMQPADAIEVASANYLGAVSVITRCTPLLKRPGGFVVGITSVAGDRGRQSNYVYGSAKAGVTTLLQGLRNALHSSGVHVLTVKPGFVDTAMTFGKVDSPLMAQPRQVADDIIKALRREKNEIYSPWFWRPIMGIIKAIPEPIFKRLSL